MSDWVEVLNFTAAYSMSALLALPSHPYAMFSSMEQLNRTGSWLTILICILKGIIHCFVEAIWTLNTANHEE